MKLSLKKFLLTTLGIILLLLAWIITSSIISNSSMIFPNPVVTLQETFKLLGDEYTYKCIGGSVFKTFIGFIISFGIALVLGTLAGNNKNIKVVLSPLFSIMKSIPTASLVFLFLVLVGAKNAPILMVVLISMPIIYESVVRGFENIDEYLVNAARVDGAYTFRRITKIYLPNIVPYILVGIASSFSLSFKIEIMAEVISGTTSKGLGSVISACQKSDPTNMVPIFAYSLITVVIVALLSLVLYLVEAKFSDTKR